MEAAAMSSTPRESDHGVHNTEADAASGSSWVDEGVQPVRPYLVVPDIRDCPRHEMRLDTVLTATTAGIAGAGTDRASTLPPEAGHALDLCNGDGCSVAEIAANIDQPILVTKTLLTALIDTGALVIAPPAVPHNLDTGRPDPRLLQALLEGLQAHDFAA
jgi:hypothetical protein